MSNDFYSVMLRRNDLLHRQAVWQEIIDHLSKFLDTDASPASVGIRTEGSGMVVPQDRVDVVISEIRNGYMAEIAAELKSIDKSEVSENVEHKKQSSKKKKAKGKQTKAAAPRPKKDKRKAVARK